MAGFLQQVVSGLATGGIYASLALAIVLIHRATGVINFAQGEMATFTTFVAWTLTRHGVPYWGAFVLTLAIAFALGIAVERTVIRPVEQTSVLAAVIVTLGLFSLFNGLSIWIWGGADRPFPSAFPTRAIHVGGVAFSIEDLGVIAVAVASVVALWLLFGHTKLGLALRAAAANPAESRLVGIRVGWMLAIGWGLGAMLGALSGMLAAPTEFLGPGMMQAVLLYALAAAILGGLDSPAGAVVGGLVLGVVLNLLGAYVGFIGASLRLPVGLVVILLVLVFRPAGLFGRVAVHKV